VLDEVVTRQGAGEVAPKIEHATPAPPRR
jgi:hypothetical protein